MERTGWPKVMEVDGISLLQVAHMLPDWSALLALDSHMWPIEVLRKMLRACGMLIAKQTTSHC